jgi:hypothetical protein
MSAQLIVQGAGAGLGISITVPTPPFPNVPALPGVPQLARSLLFAATTPPMLGFAANPDVLWRSTQTSIVWGVYDDNNNLVVNADSVQDLGWRKENRMPNFPIQLGQFGSYNRVGLPEETSVMLSKGSANGEGLAARRAFLQQIDAIADQQNINLYTIRTPEKSYFNASVTRAEMSRRGTANANYIDVELYFIEIAPVAAQYSTVATPTNNASVPSAIPPTNQGLSNPQVPVGSIANLAPWWTS